MNVIETDELKVILGEMGTLVHVDAVHSAKPKSDLLTGDLVEKIVSLYPCSGIIAKISRLVVDLNRLPEVENPTSVAVTQAYRGAIQQILVQNHLLDEYSEELRQPYLHLALHGMRDENDTPFTIELGTRHGQSCSPEVRDWAVTFLENHALSREIPIEIVIDRNFIGDRSKMIHRYGDQNDYLGYGENYHAIQVELARTLRQNYLHQVAQIFADLAREFSDVFS